MEKLNAAWQKVSQNMYQGGQQQAADPQQATGDAGNQSAKSESKDDNVQDADYEVVDDNKKD